MKTLIAMSGGVDSSVAAKCIVDSGGTAIGAMMRLYDTPGDACGRSCCTQEDAEDARAVARRLGIPFYVFNFQDAFAAQVMAPFAASYLAGRTPNPCIDCNRYLKFDRLLHRAEELHCDRLATGHYARIERDGSGRFHLKKAADETKDQSYVLCDLSQEQLARLTFPLGGLRKSEVRRIAAEGGFVNADKPDSQDICFVPDGDYAAVIEQITGKPCAPGHFVDTQGHILGTHRGLCRYTVGQRRGLPPTLPGRRYVCRLCPEENTVVLGEERELYSRTAAVGDVHFTAGDPPAAQFRCRVRTRYRQPEQEAAVTVLSDGRLRLRFDEPQRAITPGQTAALYDGDEVLGGGRILPPDDNEEG